MLMVIPFRLSRVRNQGSLRASLLPDTTDMSFSHLPTTNSRCSAASPIKRVHLGALKYVPHTVMKLLENIPYPWEQVREVPVLYHITGAITFVNKISRACLSCSMEYNVACDAAGEVGERRHFKCMRFPPFDDEEPPLDYGDNILVVDPLKAIQLNFDSEEDAAILDWFYDPQPLINISSVNGSLAPRTSIGRFHFPSWPNSIDFAAHFFPTSLTIMPAICSEKHLLCRQSPDMATSGRPMFKPLYRDMDTFDEDWNVKLLSDNRYARNTRSYSRIFITPYLAPSAFYVTTYQKKCIFALTTPTCPRSTPIHSSIPFLCVDSHQKMHRFKSLSVLRLPAANAHFFRVWPSPRRSVLSTTSHGRIYQTNLEVVLAIIMEHVMDKASCNEESLAPASGSIEPVSGLSLADCFATALDPAMQTPR
jgi:PRO8NT (NUC069), PrP8 N-terminal domain